jgi:regulator of extracellular matrix RemA (YlzA/DUF370 family)
MSEINPVLHIGGTNYILTEKVIAVMDATTKQAQKILRDHTNVYDTTRNRRCLSYLLCSGNLLIKTSIKSSTLIKRLDDGTWIKEEEIS